MGYPVLMTQRMLLALLFALATNCAPSRPTPTYQPPPKLPHEVAQDQARLNSSSDRELEKFASEVELGRSAQSSVARMNHPKIAWLAGTWCHEPRVDPSTKLVRPIHNYVLLEDGAVRKSELQSYFKEGVAVYRVQPTRKFARVRVVSDDVIELYELFFGSGKTTKNVIRVEKTGASSITLAPEVRYTMPSTALDTSFSVSGKKEKIGTKEVTLTRCPWKE